MTSNPQKIVIIGAGPAGYVGAIRAAQLGAKVILIEKGDVGGVCLNVGCIPTKVLTSAAHTLTQFKRSDQFGIKSEASSLDLPQLMRKKEQTVRRFVSGVKHLLKSHKITTISGTARLLEKKTIELRQKDGKKEKMEADRILICTGSVPVVPNIPGIDSEGILGSTEALDIQSLPEKFLIIGAGAIGCEFASIYHAFGSEVILVEMLSQILPSEDEEISKNLRRLWERKGIEIHTDSKVTKIANSKNDKKKVTVSTSEGEKQFEVDKILLSAGRKAHISDLGIEEVGIKTEKGAVLVDEGMRTNVENIYAAGDCIGGWLYAHVASMEAEIAVENALGQDKKMDYTAVPGCIFTHPEVGSVGLTEKQAKDKGIDVKIGRFPFIASGRALCENEPDGMVKIIAEEKSGKIIGAHILGNRATDLISELTLGIEMGATVDDIIQTIHPHPTLSEPVREAAMKLKNRPIHIL
jgi:dihydrolipoamide dehydrogenase